MNALPLGCEFVWGDRAWSLLDWREEWSGMMNKLHVTGGLLIMAILSVEMRCLSDVVLRESREEQRSRGRIETSFNLAAKWTLWHVVSVQRTRWDTSPLHLLWKLSPSSQTATHVENLESDLHALNSKQKTKNRGFWLQEGTRRKREESRRFS